MLFSTFLFSPDLSFKPFPNIAAGPGEMVSCRREEEQKANRMPESARQSLYEAVERKFVQCRLRKAEVYVYLMLMKIPFLGTLQQENQI